MHALCRLRSCAFGPLQRQALLSLYNGEDTLAPLPRVQDLLAEQHAVRRRLSRPGAKAHHDGAAGSDSDGPAAESRVSEDELNDEQLYGILGKRAEQWVVACFVT